MVGAASIDGPGRSGAAENLSDPPVVGVSPEAIVYIVDRPDRSGTTTQQIENTVDSSFRSVIVHIVNSQIVSP